jgi:hypothetical protein
VLVIGRHIVALLALAVLAAGPAAAKNQESRGVAKIRVLHDFFSDAVPQPAKVEIRVGKNTDPAANPVKFTVSYGDVSRVQRIKAGQNVVAVFPAGSTTSPLFQTTLTLRGGDRRTLVARQTTPTDPTFTVDVLDEKTRKPKRGETNVRVLHGIPSAAADGVRFGIVGRGCLGGLLSFGGTDVDTTAPGKVTIGVFENDDTCAGTPLDGLTVDGELRARTLVTVVAQPKPGNDPTALRLQLVKDF